MSHDLPKGWKFKDVLAPTEAAPSLWCVSASGPELGQEVCAFARTLEKSIDRVVEKASLSDRKAQEVAAPRAKATSPSPHPGWRIVKVVELPDHRLPFRVTLKPEDRTKPGQARGKGISLDAAVEDANRLVKERESRILRSVREALDELAQVERELDLVSQRSSHGTLSTDAFSPYGHVIAHKETSPVPEEPALPAGWRVLDRFGRLTKEGTLWGVDLVNNRTGASIKSEGKSHPDAIMKVMHLMRQTEPKEQPLPPGWKIAYKFELGGVPVVALTHKMYGTVGGQGLSYDLALRGAVANAMAKEIESTNALGNRV